MPGALCIFRLLILVGYLLLVPSLWLPFYFCYDVIWWIYAHNFDSPIYQSILSYEVRTFYALFKKAFCSLTPQVIKIFFYKSLSVLPFIFELLIHWEFVGYVIRMVFNFWFSTWTANCPSITYSITVSLYCSEVLPVLYTKCPYRHKHVSILGSLIPLAYLSIPASVNKNFFFKQKTYTLLVMRCEWSVA